MRNKSRKNFEKDLEGERKRYNFAVPKEKKSRAVGQEYSERRRQGSKRVGSEIFEKKCNNKM
jgi:hypothetical protein